MVLHSHVSFVILLNDAEGKEVTEHLGIPPTEIRETKVQTNRDDISGEEKTIYAWHLASPKDETFELTDRIAALVELIAPIGPKIVSLDPAYRRWIDLLFHVTPEKPDQLAGEFFWFRIPPGVMGKLSACNLAVSHEIFWFDHPDTKRGGFHLPPFLQKWFPGKRD